MPAEGLRAGTEGKGTILSWRGYVGLWAGLSAARALATYFIFHAELRPDFGLYTRGGIGLYPSPVGRLLGASLGHAGLAILSAIAAGLTVALVADLSGSRKAVLAFVLLPLGWNTAFAGTDSIGLALLLLATIVRRRRRLYATLAGATHLAALPYAAFLWGGKRAVFVAAAIAGAVLALTPYGGIAGHVHEIPRGLGIAAIAYALAYLQLLAVGRWRNREAVPDIAVHLSMQRWAIWLLVVGALESGLELHLQTRYMLYGFAFWIAYNLRGPIGARGR